MLNKQGLESFLEQSLLDFRLDNQERAELRAWLDGLDHSERNFIRNRAFDLARDAIEKEPDASQPIMFWLQKVVKTSLPKPEAASYVRAHFSPGDECREAIIQRINAARRTLDICVFTISDDRISESILAAHQRSIKVRIVSDNDKSGDKGSDIYRLGQAGVPIRLDRSSYHMHHKYALIDDNYLITGSFNWTRSASDKNQENIILLDDESLVSEFAEQFDSLWQRYE